MLSLLACNKPIEVGQQGLKVLIETCRDIRESNVVLLNRAEVTIKEKGNRTRDLEMLEEVNEALSLRKSHELDLNLDGLEIDESLQIDNVNIIGFVSAFGEQLQQLSNDPATNIKIQELEDLAQQYMEDNTLLNLLLLDMHIANLESHMISTLAMAIGDTDTFGFDGKVYFYRQTLEPIANNPVKTVISLGHDVIGTSISITEPEVLINSNNSTAYEIESFDTGLWQLTFIPQVAGPHKIKFTTYFIPEAYPSERYAFTGEFELIVE
ncbi:MAG: hypothetical protein RIF33_04970 [Cyclobacteriaceae bacterium]